MPLCSHLGWKEEHVMFKRRRFKQMDSLKDRLASFAKDVQRRATMLPPGREKEEMLKKARQADIACHLDEWANSPGLRAPK
jgi:hypothetical protein